MKDFANKTVVIYDAAHDLGPQYTKALLQRGAKIIAFSSDRSVMCDLRGWEESGELIIAPVDDLDLSSSAKSPFDSDTVPSIVDVVIHNDMRSHHPNVPTEEYAVADWTETFLSNIHSAFLLTKELIPRLKRSQRGSICFVSTSSSYATLLGDNIKVAAAYEAANSALNRYAKRLAVELGPFSVNVNTLCAGNVDKDNLSLIIEKIALNSGASCESIRQELLSKQVLKGFIPPAHIVNQLCHLVSDDSEYITGQDLIISGGLELA